jgi:predicted RNA-binding Zn-ribbon protein involved in translation (DUF1610 family)
VRLRREVAFSGASSLDVYSLSGILYKGVGTLRLWSGKARKPVKAVWVTLALIVIVGSLAFLLSYYGTRPEPGEAVPHRMPVACTACGKAYIAMVGRQPAECAFCGEETVWRAKKCANAECGAIVPVVNEELAGLRCPKCDGTRFKEVRPTDENLEEP